jgi:hypothetical protein
MAIESPANVITLMVTPRRLSTNREAMRDNGMIVALINATRHSNRKKEHQHHEYRR